MKPAPNYIPGYAPDGKWKEELLKYLAKIFDLKIFVETGSCEASTLLAVHKSFEQCYSIELSDYYFERASKRVRRSHAQNIKLYHGNSAHQLRWILQREVPKQPILFWLDAHSSGGLTANEGNPLPDEIKAIMELSPDSLVVIDDEPNDEYVKEQINDEWETQYHYGITFLYKKGKYQIPEFE